MGFALLSLILVFIFGACIGSFLNVVIWRMPRGEQLNGRSHCPHCHHVLAWYTLIPLFSFVRQRARCAYCEKSISWRYPLIETITGALFVFVWYMYAPVTYFDFMVAARALFATAVVIAIFVIDLEHYLILDRLLIRAGMVILLFNIVLDIVTGSLWSLHGYTINGLLTAVAATTPFFALWFGSRGRWIGFGDVKYMLLIGAIVGWPLILVSVMSAFFLGSAVSIVLLALQRKRLTSAVPFGTFLSVGVYIALIWGQPLITWYWRLIGF